MKFCFCVSDDTNIIAIALYVIFLGIIPIIIIIVLSIRYKGNNSTCSMWNKLFLSTYTSIIKFYHRIRNFFARKDSEVTNEESRKVFTISDELPKNNLRITEQNFVCSTNPGVIKFSKEIKRDPSAIPGNSKNIVNMNLSDGKNQKQIRKIDESSCSNSESFYESNSEIYMGFKKIDATQSAHREPNVSKITKTISPTVKKKYYYAKKPPPPPIS